MVPCRTATTKQDFSPLPLPFMPYTAGARFTVPWDAAYPQHNLPNNSWFYYPFSVV